MQWPAQPTRVSAIANLIGESGETVKQPLPDFSARYPTIKDHNYSESGAHLSLTLGKVGFYPVFLSTNP
jgi:hypothetical protein